MNCLTICRCNACNGEIEFEPRRVGETIDCPHCSRETVLYIRGVSLPELPPHPIPQPEPPPVPRTVTRIVSMPPEVVVVHQRPQQGVTFGGIFKIVLYVIVTLIIIGIFL